jgi:signal transduction histidine kinase
VTGLSAATTLCETDPDGQPRRLQALSDVGVRAMEEIERLIADLRPTLLDDLGLVPALRWLIQSHKDELPAVGLDVSLGRARLPGHIEVELFRITQESLKNVIRHAEATQVSVILATESDRVRLMVEDNGIGFDPQAAMDPASVRPAWGLLGMRERAEGLGGTMEIDSSPGAGARLRFDIPLSEVR